MPPRGPTVPVGRAATSRPDQDRRAAPSRLRIPVATLDPAHRRGPGAGVELEGKHGRIAHSGTLLGGSPPSRGDASANGPLTDRDTPRDESGDDRTAPADRLSVAQRRFRLLAACAGDLVLRVAPGGEILQVEPPGGAFGLAPAELTGRPLSDVLGAAAGGAGPRDALGDVALRGRLVGADGGDGEEFEAAVRALRDDDGAVEERLVVIRSAEAARRSDAALACARAQFTALARHIPGGAVFLFDTAGRYLLADGASVGPEMTNGVDPIGRTPAEVYPPGVAEYVQRLYDAALAGQESTFRRDAANGRVYDITVTPVEVGGEVVGGMSLLLDVTDRAHMEQEQEALRQISDAVFEGASPDAVLGLVVEHVAEIFHAAGAAIFRFEHETEAVVLASAPVGVSDFLPDPRVPVAGTAVGRVAQTGRAVFVSEYPEGGPHDPLVVALRRLGAVGGAAAPISIRQRLWGALGIGSADAERLTEQTAMRLTRFAELVATDIGNVEAWHALAHDASTDLLTGLPNRRTFVEHLGTEMARARRFRHPLALVLFDIDHFKAVNDTHGHLVGDRVLSALARVVASEARGEEMIARIGGEEFAMILPETDGQGATAAAERLRRAVAAALLGDIGVTISLGIDVMRVGDEPDDLVFRADQALYRAKADGRNLTRRWEPGGDAAPGAAAPPS